MKFKFALLRALVPTLLLCTGWGAAAEKRPLALDDLARVQDVSEPALSPDGETLVYSVSHVNRELDKAVSDIWMTRYDGSERLQLTHSDSARNTHALWSPDGRWIAFLSDRDNPTGETQVWVLARGGGGARQLTELKGGVSDFVWSPDSAQLALIAGDDPKDATKKPGEKSSDKRPATPIVIERFQFKEDVTGYLTDARHHLYAFDIAARNATLLTPGAHDEFEPAWAPDGRHIAYVSKRGADPDRHYRYHIYLTEPHAGAAERELTSGPLSDLDPYWSSAPAWSPDSRRIAFLRADEEHWQEFSPWQVAIVDVADGKISTPADIDRCVYKPRWSLDGKSIYGLLEESRNTYLSRIDAVKGTVTRLTEGARFDSDYAIGRKGLFVLGSDDTHPAELYAVAKPLRALSKQNDVWLREVNLQPAQNITFASKDGTRIDGYLITPAGYQSGTKYPAILRIHGGPVYQFSHEFMFEWQLLAANGYALIAANPRGSSGRGFEFARAIYADWGHRDVEDVLAAVDHAVALGVADPERLGVGGWSYGSILTNYVIASDTRFKAATSGAGSSNFLGMYGVDMYVREYESELGRPWEKPDNYLRLSYPFLHADRIKTPTLFLCSEKDYNVPCVGAQQMYQALRSLDVPTRLVMYPEQYHEIDVPSYRADRLQQYLDWFGKYLR